MRNLLSKTFFRSQFYSMCCFTGALMASQYLYSQETIVLSTVEKPPYVGEHLANKGFAIQVISEAFAEVNYDVKFEFMPYQRAMIAAKKGSVDGLAPTFVDPANTSFAYSNEFPGNIVGFLKKKTTDLTGYSDENLTEKERLDQLKSYHIGLVKGAGIHPALETDEYKTFYVKHDLQNIDKLAMDRLHLVAIDKYSAADALVNFRPHLIGDLTFMRPALAFHDFSIGFSKNKSDYEKHLKAFNKGLKLLEESGRLEAIQLAHGLYDVRHDQHLNTKKIVIATVDNYEMSVMQKLSKNFLEKNPGIEIEWRVLDENTLRQRLLSDIAITDGQFDIMTIGAYEAQIWARSGWIKPLENLPESYNVADVIPNVMQALSFEEKPYALPFYAESSMTYYRKDLFAANNLKMPAAPTYDQIASFAKKVHDPKNDVYGICLRAEPNWGGNIALLTTMANSYGGRWFDEAWQPTLDTSAWKMALKKYKDLLTQYGPPQFETNGFNENLKLFADGHCGMWIDATVAAGFLFNKDLSTVSDKVAVTAAPIGTTAKGSHWLWTWALAIPSSSQKSELAQKFITWATSEEYINLVAESEGWVSVPPGTRRSTYAQAEYVKAAPFSPLVLQSIEAADPIDSTELPKPYTGIQLVDIPEFAAIGYQAGIYMLEAVKGTISVDEALEKSQRFASQQMLKSGFYKKKMYMKRGIVR